MARGVRGSVIWTSSGEDGALGSGGSAPEGSLGIPRGPWRRLRKEGGVGAQIPELQPQRSSGVVRDGQEARRGAGVTGGGPLGAVGGVCRICDVELKRGCACKTGWLVPGPAPSGRRPAG